MLDLKRALRKQPAIQLQNGRENFNAKDLDIRHLQPRICYRLDTTTSSGTRAGAIDYTQSFINFPIYGRAEMNAKAHRPSRSPVKVLQSRLRFRAPIPVEIRSRRRKLHLAVCLALAASVEPAGADVFEVTSAADAGVGSLRAAIAEANVNAGEDIIEFAMGLSDITLDSGQLEITDDLKIIGPDARQVISGNSASRILNMSAGQHLELVNLELVNGRTSLDRSSVACSEIDGQGGAVCVNGVDLVLRDVIARNNETTGGFAHGGAVRGDKVTVYASAFDSNSAADGRGGAIYAAGDLLLSDTVVIGNFSGNSGGGIYADANPGIVTVTNSIIDSNTAEGTGGGLRAKSAVEIHASTLSRNSSRLTGGALSIRYGDGVISNSTISGNSVDVIFFFDGVGGAVKVVDANLDIDNSTITGNSANNGGNGGVSVSSTSGNALALNLDSSVLAGNIGNTGNFTSTAEEAGSVTVNAGFSMFGDPAEEINGVDDSNLFSDDPGLSALQDNGCGQRAGSEPLEQCTPTHHPTESSPLIDSGRNSADLSTEQRGTGFPRVLGGAADIGATEFPASLLTLTPDPLAFGNLQAGGRIGPMIATIANSGTAGLEVTMIDMPSSPFILESTNCPPTPFNLGAGESCTSGFEFAPESPGEFNQMIWVESDGASGSDTEFSLTGTSGQFDVAVIKSNAAEFVLPGVPAIYNIQVLNLGLSDLFGVEIVDILPPELDATGATWTCTPGTGVTCPIDSGTGDIDELVDIPAGAGMAFTLVAPVIAEEGVDVVNTVTATMPAGIEDEDPSNNEATDSDPVAMFAGDFEFAGCSDDLIENRFCVIDENVVLDIVTGLEWQRCAFGRVWDEANQICTGDASGVEWDDAVLLAPDGGWRLPSVEELSTLRYCSDGDPALFLPSVSGPGIRCNNVGDIIQPVIEPEAFPNWPLNAPVGPPWFWTTTDGPDFEDSDGNIIDGKIAVSFGEGSILNVNKVSPIQVLLVRG